MTADVAVAALLYIVKTNRNVTFQSDILLIEELNSFFLER